MVLQRNIQKMVPEAMAILKPSIFDEEDESEGGLGRYSVPLLNTQSRIRFLCDRHFGTLHFRHGAFTASVTLSILELQHIYKQPR